MASPYTGTSAVTNLVTTALDKSVEHALRPAAQLRSCVTKRPVNVTSPGSVVNLYIYQDFDVATTPLNEETDGNGQVMANPTAVPVTINEYGAYTVVTKRLEEFTFADALEADVVNQIAQQQLATVDKLIDTKLAAGTQVITVEGGTVTVTGNDVDSIVAGDLVEGRVIRHAVTKMRAAGVAGFRGDLFLAHVHPDVAADLREQSGSGGWRQPSEYSAPQGIWAGETGTFEGAVFVENPRVGVADNVGGVAVYNTYIMGQGALAEAVADEFHVELGGVVSDPYKRKTVVAWTGMAGWALYRTPAMWVAKTASSFA